MSTSNATRVLFDEPGPRGRRRILLWTIAVAVATAAALGGAIFQFWNYNQLDPVKWQAFTQPAMLKFLLKGLRGTFLATAAAAVVAFPLGVVLALGRHGGGLLGRITTAWIEFFRSMPLLLVVYAFLLALPRFGVVLPVFWMLVVPMILVSSASTAEVFRAGINAVAIGQSEAAAALGMSRSQAMRLVVFPQAFRLVLPNLLTQLVSLLKDSTLGYVVSYPELMQQGRNLTSYTNYMIQTYLVIAMAYIVINYLLTTSADHLQRRVTRRAQTDQPVQGTLDLELAHTQ